MTSSSDFNIKNLEKSKSVNYNSTSRCDNRRQLEKSTSFFSPDSSIRSGLKELDRISKELQEASQDLVSSIENHGGGSSSSSQNTNNTKGGGSNGSGSLAKLDLSDVEDKANHCNITALQSSLQTLMILDDLNHAMVHHEKDMVSRAGSLNRKSQEMFPKMNSKAVQRLSSTSSNSTSRNSSMEDLQSDSEDEDIWTHENY